MKSAQTMLVTVSRVSPGGRVAALAAVLALSALSAGCEGLRRSRPELTPPVRTVAPYDVSNGDVLWAVLPLANESGTDLFDPLIVSDKLVAAAERVQGVRTVPLNRTLQAMQALEMSRVSEPGDIVRLATAMGVDGVLVGTITEYDPYNPPTFGMNLALFARSDAMSGGLERDPLDPRALSGARTDSSGPRSGFRGRPASVVSANLDGKDHGVLAALQAYASGRHDPDTALGWRRYTASMDLYTEFATEHLVFRLMEREWERVGRMHTTEDPSSP